MADRQCTTAEAVERAARAVCAISTRAGHGACISDEEVRAGRPSCNAANCRSFAQALVALIAYESARQPSEREVAITAMHCDGAFLEHTEKALSAASDARLRELESLSPPGAAANLGEKK